MAQAVFGSPIKKVYGETVSLTTTAAHLLYRPNYHEVMLYCASAWRMGIAPRLAQVLYYNASTYTNYTTQATDRVSTTHVPLDAMATTHYCYLGFTAPVRGWYANPVTNVNAETGVITGAGDCQYLYDVSDATYRQITGTLSGALTVGETVTQATSGATGVLVYGPAGSTYIVVKTITGVFKTGAYTISGATQNLSTITAIVVPTKHTGYFTDCASVSDGTESGGATLAVPGLVYFTLPSVVSGIVDVLSPIESLCWYRFATSKALSAAVDVVDFIPACDTVNYAYMQAGITYQFSLNLAQNGAFEFDHTGADTLSVDWIQH